MTFLNSIFLGIVQGLTEFLPVSSSGHLVIFQKILPGFSQPGVLFDVILHFGTLFALIIYFWKKILTISKEYLLLLIIGSIPAVVIGILFKDYLESTYSIGGVFLGIQFLITAVFCLLIDRKKTDEKKMNISDSLLIGIFQAFAILPAISRSASTIFAGVGRGIDRKKAAEFSFLLSIPAVFGANILEIFSFKDQITTISFHYLLGFIVAFITGLFTIKLTISLLTHNKFIYFTYYCFIIGLLVLIFL